MRTQTIQVVSKNGIHMRPAGLIVDTASAYESDVKITNQDGTEADAKSILNVSMLAILVDEMITITADGSDEDKAVDALVELVESDFSKILTE